MGLEAYRKMVTTLPPHLRDGFVKDRLVGKIEPILRMSNPSKDERLELSA
jgi:hypothetical protein